LVEHIQKSGFANPEERSGLVEHIQKSGGKEPSKPITKSNYDKYLKGLMAVLPPKRNELVG